VGHFAYTTFIGRWLGYGIQVKNCGPWAGNIIQLGLVMPFEKKTKYYLMENICKVVTGATDGIGKAFAHAVNYIFLIFFLELYYSFSCFLSWQKKD